MPRIQLEPAYILHTRAYRESSLLLEILTRDHGRQALVARGAKGPRSRWRSILQPFRPLLVSWTARGELGTLTAADQVAAPPPLQAQALYCGMYLNEILVRLLHRSDPHAEVFEKYRNALAQLAAGQPPQPLLRVFEKQLLEAIGFGLQLAHVHGSRRPVSKDSWYEYLPGKGAVEKKRTPAMEHRLVSGRALLALQAESLQAEDLPELKRMLRRVMRYHLGDKPLASLALFTTP
jgi:DNA repair protein RecO (recombination protein O)